MDARIKAVGGNFKYCCADHLTVGDVMLFTWLNTLRCGFLDDTDTGYLSQFPTLENKVNAIAAHPAVKAYYDGKTSDIYQFFKSPSSAASSTA